MDGKLNVLFHFSGQGILPGFISTDGNKGITLGSIIDRLKQTYCMMPNLFKMMFN